MYQLIFAAVIGISLFGTGMATGVRLEGDHRDALALKDEKLADAKVKAEQDKAQAAATDLERTREQLNAKQQVVTQTVTRVVTHRIYARACFDADGLRIANAALQGSTADPAKPDVGVSRPHATGGRNGSGGAPKTH